MKSWRDVLSIHPAAELFPMMSEAELRELDSDISNNGLQSKVGLWKDADHRIYLLDGRSRLDALELIGETVTVKDGFPSWSGADRPWCFLEGDPYDIALSLNLHRRHLDADQKRGVIEKAIKAHPERAVDHAPNPEPEPVPGEPDTVPATEKPSTENGEPHIDSGLALRFFKEACDHFLPCLNKDDAAEARVYFNEWTAKNVKAEAKAKAAA